MIGVAQAQARLLALGIPVAAETLPLADAAGRWTAAAVIARRTQPARNLSAMDGYAVRHADLPGPLRVIGESAAGRPFDGQVGVGEAVRIFTGAALPADCDSIVIQENVDRRDDRITLTKAGGEGGTHVRTAGSDFASGATLIEPGEFVSPARIALAAMGGHGTLCVRRRIRIALISTGDELVEAGVSTAGDRLPASNAPMLTAMLATLPVEITDFGIIRDDLEALSAAFTRARSHDVILTTGGVSVGDHDLVRPALVEAGADLDFWKVAMRPGKPLMAGTLGNSIVLGLPGNPVSAFVTAIMFLKPLVAHLSGARYPLPRLIPARLAGTLPATGDRTDFVRAFWRDGVLAPTKPGDSGTLVPLALADALIVREAGSRAAANEAWVAAILIA